MAQQNHSAPGSIAPGVSRDKSRPEKSQLGERTAAQIRFENEQSHERISQIDKTGRRHPAPPGDSPETRPNPGDVTR